MFPFLFFFAERICWR